MGYSLGANLLPFLKILIFPFSRAKISNFSLRFSLPIALLALGLLGLARTVFSAELGLVYKNGVWFSYDPGVIFTMLWFPVFLCVFPAMVFHFFLNRWGIRCGAREIFGVFFYLQIVHLLLIPFDLMHVLLRVPYFYRIFTLKQHVMVSISPLAATPLIFFVTEGSSLGILVAWIFSTVLVVALGIKLRAPMLRYLLLGCVIFYLMHAVTYPTLQLFFVRRHNFFYGMYFLIGSVGPLIYFWPKIEEEPLNSIGNRYQMCFVTHRGNTARISWLIGQFENSMSASNRNHASIISAMADR